MLRRFETTRIINKNVTELIDEIPFDSSYKIINMDKFGEVAVIIPNGELKTPKLKITKKYWIERICNSPGLGLGDLIFFGMIGRKVTKIYRLIAEAEGIRFDITHLLENNPETEHYVSNPGAPLMPIYMKMLQHKINQRN
jgi:hypothetical protein